MQLVRCGHMLTLQRKPSRDCLLSLSQVPSVSITLSPFHTVHLLRLFTHIPPLSLSLSLLRRLSCLLCTHAISPLLWKYVRMCVCVCACVCVSVCVCVCV